MDYKKALAFVKEKHAGQVHANNVPVWHHLERVSKRLEFYLKFFGEGDAERMSEIVMAALGHDLLEDTNATQEEVAAIFGEYGYSLIFHMTNEWGDHDVGPYVEKVSSAPEEVRLMKLSDLNDNLLSVTYNIAVLTPQWTAETFLPIVAPMKEAVLKTSFATYEKTSEAMKISVDNALTGLNEELERFGAEK